jgi:hypothetical protein
VSSVTSTSTTTEEKPRILLVVNSQNMNNRNQTNNTVVLASGSDFDPFLILWIIITIILLSLCVALMCCLCNNDDNNVHPMPVHQGYTNPVYENKQTKKVEAVVTDEFEYRTAEDVRLNKNSMNPLYKSGSSIASEHNYDVVERNILKNETYGMVTATDRSRHIGAVANTTYGFPQDRPTSSEYLDIAENDDNTDNYDHLDRRNSKIRKTSEIRPSSAFKKINKIPESKNQSNKGNQGKINISELEHAKSGLRKYRPTVRKEITDESISRRKGNLMSELTRNLPDKCEI